MLMLLMALGASRAPAGPPFLRVTMQADLGEDLGQNPGTLFEAYDGSGRPVVGAGFLGAYNTYYRSDRHVVHFYVRTPVVAPAVTTLPRPTPDSGAYIFDADGTLYARSASGGSGGRGSRPCPTW